MKDAALVGLALLVVFACVARVAARLFLADAAANANSAAARLEHALLTYPPSSAVPEPPEVVIPPRRRSRSADRAGSIEPMEPPWDDATPEQRREAILAALPIRSEDSNGITAGDVARRLGITRGPSRTSVAGHVAPTLRKLKLAGEVVSAWDEGPKRRRVYWRKTP